MRIDQPARRGRLQRRSLIIAGVAVVVALVILSGLATFYTDLLWFREVKFTNVFWTQIRVKAELGVVFGLIFAVLLLANLWVVQKVTSPHRLFTLEDQLIERYRATLRPYVRYAIVLMALVFGLFAGSGATGQWRAWLLFRNSTPFGSVDPLFHKDLAFYVFRLPFHRFVFAWTFSSLIVITLITAAAHYLMGGIRFDARGGRATPQVKAHISVLLSLMVLLKAWGYRLDQFGLLYSPRGTVTGASYTDVHAQLPALKLLVIMAVLVGILFLVNIRVRNWAIPIGGIGLLFLTSILVGGAYPALVQRLRVTPAERLKETPFIQRNIVATRTAFNIGDQVTVKQFPGDSNLNQAAIQRNQGTIENIRLWSPGVLAQTYSQLQRIRQYYEFLDVDVDRYLIGGKMRQVMLSAREISQRSLSGNSASWQNTHLFFTHGNGVVASRVDKVTAQGRPSFVTQDVPPVSIPGAPTVADARLYFGESEETPYVAVRTGIQELDYPQGQGESFQGNKYEGTGGIRVSSFMRRAAFAWRFRDANLLLSSTITGDSRLLFRRSIQDRIIQVAPYLKLDADPYVVITPDRLLWVQDAYTTTDMYPYSERVNLSDATRGDLGGTANYIRNSVKVTVDAVDGTVTLYVVDPTDPLIRAWQRIFPGNFKTLSDASPELRAHFRYPEDLFLVQAAQFRLYHITDPATFYTREDAWSLPDDPAAAGQKLPPFYMLMRLPGETKEEFLLMVPFTPSDRDNMTAWLAARSDPTDYGHLIAYTLPKQRLALGPSQVEAQIKQDPDFSRQQTLLGQAGSSLIFGNLLTIPVENSLLYVQPFYLAAQGSQIPELKFVVAVQGEDVGLGTDLNGALASLLGAAPPVVQPPTTPAGKTTADLIASALAHYNAAQDALKNGDFATYGREQAAMKAALDQLAQAAGATPSPSPSPSRSP